MTLVLVFLVIALTAAATVCVSVVFVLAMLVLAYSSNRSMHNTLLAKAHRVNEKQTPELNAVAELALDRLQVRDVEIFVVQSNQVNAYTFGLTSPNVIVLNSALFQIMDADELAFIMGHEMGHVQLGHTWLNTLVGGMAGIPSPSLAFAILHLAFRWWNRACEFSADRAGMLACSKPHKAISALIKIAEGTNPRTKAELERAFARIDAEDDDLANNLSELLATHPMIIKRIQNLRDYAKSPQYQRLQTLVDQNLTI